MRQIIALILVLSFACTNPKHQTEPSAGDTTLAASERTQIVQEKEQQQINLKDTTTNGIEIKFLEISKRSFDSLHQFGKHTDLPLQPFDSKITIVESCITFMLHNGKTDSLCNKHDGEYYEKYQVKGLWKNTNLVLVNFQNWEERHDFFVNLTDGEYYMLMPFYIVSPKLDVILSYVDISASPIYSSELLISEVGNGNIKTLMKKDLGQMTITDAAWISNKECLLSVGMVEAGSGNVTDSKKFLMKLD